ncbi:MAG: restriction endonuclease [Eubacteriales bacterium]
MGDELINYGDIERKWNAAGTKILKYTKEMYHEGLNEHKLISAPDISILENKVSIQGKKWSEKWNKKIEKERKELEKEANIEEAEKLTLEAENELKLLDELLIYTLNVDDKVNWDSLKNFDDFPEKSPDKPKKYKIKEIQPEPELKIPPFTFFEKVFSPLKNKKIKIYEDKYKLFLQNWEKEKIEIERENSDLETIYNKEIKRWEQNVIDWEKRKTDFLKGQEEYNNSIEKFKIQYKEKNPDAIVEYCEIVLNNSQYPDYFPQDFELDYNPENNVLIVEYSLPSPEIMPKIKEVKYIASKKEIKEYFLPKSKITKIYDSTLYKITLRTIHELFEADVVDALDAISFNGWVKMRNASTGNMENTCILSVQVRKDDFLDISLKHVDPKQCFKSLKGVGSSKLSGISAIQPILQIDKNDRRFVQSKEVANKLDGATNIAAMDWEEFEHLIREIFEKEFTSTGGEVNVTQASRDGGVDAFAFDPDPIRGGKIVIQAKRYTNTVGVSAVRDLYGTVVNEGAIKGILVTTADYGPDAYNFSKDKPITLLNGANLLHLLEKHGHKVKIDLKEAKKILK